MIIALTAGALVTEHRGAMGSTVTFSIFTDQEAKAREAIEAGFAEFQRLEELMSVWKEGSDISRLKAQAGNEAVRVSPEVFEVLVTGKRFSEMSGGLFDVTFAGLSGLWKFDHDRDNRVPDAKEVKARLPLIDYRKLILDPKQQSAFLERREMRVNLGGIGKGYAVDRVSALFRAGGFNDFLVQAGGDLYVAGRRGDRRWRAGIRDPRGTQEEIFARLEIENATLSTSGDYERAFVLEGKRYHHILDPRTGFPARGCRSVSIITRTATQAEGWSKVVFLMGAERGMALVEATPDVGAVVVDEENQVHVSSRIREKLTVVRPPTDGI